MKFLFILMLLAAMFILYELPKKRMIRIGSGLALPKSEESNQKAFLLVFIVSAAGFDLRKFFLAFPAPRVFDYTQRLLLYIGR